MSAYKSARTHDYICVSVRRGKYRLMMDGWMDGERERERDRWWRERDGWINGWMDG